MKISANIVFFNEQYWVKESISSILPYVDEIICVDNGSTDSSIEEIRKINSEKIKIYSMPNLPLGELKNYAVSQSSGEFIIRWDADFIAYPNFAELIEYIRKNNEKFDAYRLSGPNLAGDIYHAPKGKELFGPELYIFRKGLIEFVNTERYSDYPEIKEGSKICYPLTSTLKNDIFWIHTNTLKPISKILYRANMSEWNKNGRPLNYWDWLADKNKTCRSEFKNAQINTLINKPIEIISFDFEKYGNHPSELLSSPSKDFFKVKCQDGKFYIDNYPLD
ncbi:glycosyltransferase family A protein [Chromobacterium sp. TRC.1.1.SA]|uniref:Glycosyltransferase family A protein n=1 Tax=Chromobacterium indicum TaxID=3110228 RepID=A0ABV0CRZ6_9NEIS|nr:glycosyltransferase family A protein [Chromobacterium violaceum]MCD0495150.1 glycosyltransferase family 2 protein [Chromobacterium violaceum]